MRVHVCARARNGLESLPFAPVSPGADVARGAVAKIALGHGCVCLFVCLFACPDYTSLIDRIIAASVNIAWQKHPTLAPCCVRVRACVHACV